MPPQIDAMHPEEQSAQKLEEKSGIAVHEILSGGTHGAECSLDLAFESTTEVQRPSTETRQLGRFVEEHRVSAMSRINFAVFPQLSFTAPGVSL